MLSLSPEKLLVLLVIALIVLGPEKLPQVARQLGAAWGEFRRFRSRLENDVRGAFPDLPPTHEVAQAVRSPLAFLDRLADEHERSQPSGTESAAGAADSDSAGEPSPTGPAPPLTINGTSTNGGGPGAGATGDWNSAPESGGLYHVPDDPSMN